VEPQQPQEMDEATRKMKLHKVQAKLQYIWDRLEQDSASGSYFLITRCAKMREQQWELEQQEQALLRPGTMVKESG
jgi:hypothetical protein